MKVPGNKSFFDETNYTEFADETNKSLKHKCDIEKIIEQQGDFRKFVLGTQANNELLPFSDSSFDAYISNLSVMIVNNPLNQISEAYRVLKPNTAACFSIWGRRDMSLQFFCVEKALEKFMTEDQKKAEAAIRSNFHLWEDKGEKLKGYLDQVGFKQVKMWEQPMNIVFKDGDDFMTKFGDGRLKKQGESIGLTEEQIK